MARYTVSFEYEDTHVKANWVCEANSIQGAWNKTKEEHPGTRMLYAEELTQLKRYTVVLMENVDGFMRQHTVNAFDSQEAIKLAAEAHFRDYPETEYQACVYEGHLNLVDEV